MLIPDLTLKQAIEDSIKGFDKKNIYQSSIRFFNSLGYKSNKTLKLEPNNLSGFLDNFNLSSKIINEEKALVREWLKIEFLFQIADSEVTQIQSLFNSAEYDPDEYQSFLFFAVQLRGNNYKRGDLVKITRELNLPFKMPAIILFNYGDYLTLSIIDRRAHKRESSKDVLEKVTLIKDILITKLHSAHREILFDLSLSELYKKFKFHNFRKLHEAWRATLNVSELNKNFYRDLTYWYYWALNNVTFPADEIEDEEVRNPISIIRLLTRIIFVWFLKEKNLVPDELFNKRNIDELLNYSDKTNSTYYKAILQNLFFATLNTEMNKDRPRNRQFVSRQYFVPHFYRYERFFKDKTSFLELVENIPFLNGGLFECLDKKNGQKEKRIDCFSNRTVNEERLSVPDYLFFSNPELIDLNKIFHTKGKKYKVRGLIDILQSYKFTIEENTPVEEEVALDPELLGKVFENLLASYVEETKSTARKLTGSFYTPREIVNYMVEESLLNYLKEYFTTHLTLNKTINQNLQHLLSYREEPHKLSEEEVDTVIEALDNLKILDPACGSGAFPMGMLHKIVFILSKVDPFNNRWKQKQLEKAQRDRLIAEKMEDDKNREASLLEIEKRIQDIEKAFETNNHELDYARKLYLIENCIYGIDNQAIAIQIAKLRFFIALIVDQKTSASRSEYNLGIKPLPNLETKFVAADTLVALENPKQLSIRNLDIADEIDKKELELKEIREKHFRARTPETKEKYRKLDEELREDLAKLLEKEGFPKDTTKKIANWNPYDQNASADFFDKEWMFNMQDGFDIVIGNPPYIEHKKLKHITPILKKQYETYSGTADIYVYFYEKGIKLLKASGHLTYISSNKFIKTSYGQTLREFLSKRKIKQIIDFTDIHVFDALVASCIMIISNSRASNEILFSSANDSLISFDDLRSFIESNSLLISHKKLNSDIWQLVDDKNLLLKDKIESVGQPISSFKFIKIFRGVTTGYNPAFIIDKEVRNGLIKSDKQNKKVIKPLLQGRNIKRWIYKDEDNLSIIFTRKGINIDKYPTIKDFLNKHKSKLIPGKGRKPGDYKWYEIQDNTAYYLEFENEKIIWGLTADKWAFAYDNSGYYLPSNGYILTSLKLSIKYLLALLNSKVLQYYFSFVGIMTAGGAYTLKHETIRELPIIELTQEQETPFVTLVDYILQVKNKAEQDQLISNVPNYIISDYIEEVLNGCIYELYFPQELKNAKADILELVIKDLETISRKKDIDSAIISLYGKWQEQKNEIRNRLLLMRTRVEDIIGVIEESL